MVTPRPPFLTNAEIAELHEVMGRGFQTVMELQDPPALVTIHRRDRGGTYEPIGDVELITIRMHDRQTSASGYGSGAVEVESDGELKGWHPLDIEMGDRFAWGSGTAEIVFVNPVRFGVARALFRLTQGGG